MNHKSTLNLLWTNGMEGTLINGKLIGQILGLSALALVVVAILVVAWVLKRGPASIAPPLAPTPSDLAATGSGRDPR